MKKEKLMKKEKVKGITLIALVVTIVILLILASVTITMTMGQNSIFQRAKDSKTATEIATEKDTLGISWNSAAVSRAGEKIRIADLQTALDEQTGTGKTTVEGANEGPFTVTFNDSKRQYIINQNGGVSDAGDEKADPKIADLPGSGTADDPYIIQSIEDLCILSYKTNSGSMTLNNSTVFTLVKDLDFNNVNSYKSYNTNKIGSESGYDINGDGTIEGIMEECTTGAGFRPISQVYGNEFTGVLRTENSSKFHKISNLYEGENEISEGSTEYYGGLIGRAKDIDIENITIADAKFDLSNYSETGLIIGTIKESSTKVTLKNCNISGQINGKDSIGGLIGRASNVHDIEINNCNSTVNISANTNIGGIIGYSYQSGSTSNSLTIEKCANRGNIIGTRWIYWWNNRIYR